jgi:hypothetical protein
MAKFMGNYSGELSVSGRGLKHTCPDEEMVSSRGGGVYDRIAFEHVDVPRMTIGARGSSQFIGDTANSQDGLSVVGDGIGFGDFSQHRVPILLILKT